MKKKKMYSPGAQRLLALLTDKPVTIKILIGLYYGSRPPKYARQSLNDCLRKLQLWITQNNEPFRLYSSKRRGPLEVEYYIK